jgi:hypothetical protein
VLMSKMAYSRFIQTAETKKLSLYAWYV